MLRAVESVAPAERITPHSVAVEVLQECKGNVKQAVDVLMTRLKSDAQLLRLLAEPLLQEAAHEIMAKRHRDRRATIFRNVERANHAEGHVRFMKACLLDIVLEQTGKKLGDCRGVELDRAISHYLKQGADMLRKGRWLRSIRHLVPDDVAVREKITSDQAKKLWENA